MIRRSLTGALLFLIAAQHSEAQYKSNFRIYPSTIAQGDTMLIVYDPTGTELEGMAPVKGAATLYRNFNWETVELDMKMTDSGWITRYVAPPGTALFSCRFSAGDKTDKGFKVNYGWMLMDSTGKKQQPGAFAAWGLLRAKSLRREMPNTVADSSVIEDYIGCYWIEREVRNNPGLRNRYVYDYLRLLKSAKKEAADTVIRMETAKTLSQPDLTETDLTGVYNTWKNLLPDSRKADSIARIILQRYPSGQFAWDMAVYDQFRDLKGNKDSLWKAFTKRFPLSEHRFDNTGIAQMYYHKVYRGVIYQDILRSENHTPRILEELLPYTPFYTLLDLYPHLIDYRMNSAHGKPITAAELLPYSKLLIGEIEKAGKIRDWAEARFYTAKEWEDYMRFSLRGAYQTHAFLLEQTGNAAEAKTWADKVKDIFQYRNAAFNDIYTRILLKLGREQEAYGYAVKSANENAVSTDMIALLKKQYIGKQGSEQGFDAYFASLKPKDKMEEQQAHLKAALINKEIASFNLESNRGGKISLSGQKGKIVVIDFWATWCPPCKAAMPGMQLVSDKYRNDKNVAFYFIATDETRSDYKAAIEKFLQEKNFDFNVLYDAKNPATGKLNDTYEKYSRAFGFSGIPLKMIIDAKGKLRWFSLGYMGSTSALADEISYLIETLKAEKS